MNGFSVLFCFVLFFCNFHLTLDIFLSFSTSSLSVSGPSSQVARVSVRLSWRKPEEDPDFGVGGVCEVRRVGWWGGVGGGRFGKMKYLGA